jgi:hypothetical protein
MNLNNLSSIGSIAVSLIEVGAILFAGIKFFVKLNTRLDRLEEQYKPNGGSSMRDAINRIEVQLSKLEGKFEQHVEENEE